MGIIKYLKNLIKNKRTLYVAFDSGGRKKPTIVLLHGIAATSKTWDVFIDEIDTDIYRVVALDLLGFGQSPKPVFCEYDISDHVKYIHKTLKKIRVRQPFTVIGHSMGAIIAARYCNLYPKRVKEAYLVSLPVYLKSKNIKNSISRLHNDIYMDAYKFLLKNKNFTIKHSQRLRKILQIKDGIDVNHTNWNSFKLSLSNTVINQNVYEDIEQSLVPTRVIYGLLDEFLVKNSVDKLSNLGNVTVTKVNIADHAVSINLAKEIISQINKQSLSVK